MTDVTALPEIGTNEDVRLDFKCKVVDPTDTLELAKDVAALANASGGRLVIGAIASGERLVKYTPLDGTTASEVQKSYEQACRDRCRPPPIITTRQVALEEGVVVLVEVAPVLGAAVGVTVRKKEAGNLLEGTHIYPVRVGAQTKQLSPEQLHMYVDATFRRKVIALERAIGQNVIVVGRMKGSSWSNPATLEGLEPENNLLVLKLEGLRVEFPIDLVTAVWRGGRFTRIGIPGYLDPIDGEPSEETDEAVIFFPVDPPRSK